MRAFKHFLAAVAAASLLVACQDPKPGWSGNPYMTRYRLHPKHRAEELELWRRYQLIRRSYWIDQ